MIIILLFLFPICQVRVIGFYQNYFPPRLIVLLLLQFLLDHVCINIHLYFRLANSWPTSLPTFQLTMYRWTSPWNLPGSICTTGPQPGNCPAQCTSLDLNSVHRWTSTWDLPSSVCTSRPQWPDRMPENMPDKMSDKISKDMPDKMP